jgi:hypothetical protein
MAFTDLLGLFCGISRVWVHRVIQITLALVVRGV